MSVPPGPDWTQLHWITNGNNSTGTIFLHGVNIPNGNPIPATDCGTQEFMPANYLFGDVDFITTIATIAFNSPSSFNCRARVDIFAVATEPLQRVTIRITNDTLILLTVAHAAFAALPVGTTNFDFVVPPNGGHLTVELDHSIFAPGLPLSWKITLLNL